nr:glycoside hydrolase family 3 N-terminal domain-containing protein [Actinomadura sp. CNU-125]
MDSTSAKAKRRTVRARHRVLAFGMLATLALGTGGGSVRMAEGTRDGTADGSGIALTSAERPGAGPSPYLDPSLPVEKRVADLMGRMSLDDKLGQMTQPERRYIKPAEITEYGIGSVLSSGGSAPKPNNAETWADMYDELQKAALAAPLAVPLMYGVDAVHGHNNVVGATIFPHNIGLGATRDPALVREIGARPPRR